MVVLISKSWCSWGGLALLPSQHLLILRCAFVGPQSQVMLMLPLYPRQIPLLFRTVLALGETRITGNVLELLVPRQYTAF